MTLEQRAAKQTDEIQRALSSAGAVMIPGAVKGIIQQQSQLIEDLARELVDLKNIVLGD